MQVQPLDDQKAWNEILATTGAHSFLQSWEWGEFNKLEGHKIFRLQVVDIESRPVAVALCVVVASRRGRFLFVPHGPAIIPPINGTSPDLSEEKAILYYTEILTALKNYLVKIAYQEKCAFIRVAPTLPDSTAARAIFKNLGFTKAPIYMHSERVWVLPLAGKTEDELMSQMRKTTRYLVRRAPSQNVQIEVRTDKKAVEDFWKIYKITASRERFTPFSTRYIEHEFEAFAATGNAVFLFGYHDGTPQAGALIVFTKTTAFYHQGASIHSSVPVTYALQWRAIQEAKERGCVAYNFWGILQPGRTPKSWGGLTQFKKGFGGEEVDYVPTQDYALSPRYALTYLFERYLALKRGV